MTDDFVNKTLEYIRKGENDKVNQCLREATPEQKSRIQVMLDHGLLSYSC